MKWPLCLPALLLASPVALAAPPARRATRASSPPASPSPDTSVPPANEPKAAEPQSGEPKTSPADGPSVENSPKASEPVPETSEPTPGDSSASEPPLASEPAESSPPTDEQPVDPVVVPESIPEEGVAPPVAPPPSEPVAEPSSGPIDNLSGHLRVGAAILGTIYGGDPSPPLTYGSANSLGPALDIGLGVGRNVALGLYGSLGWLSEGSSCKPCSATSATGGAFVRYHLVQGLRLDPWISYGLGVRSFQITEGGTTSDVVALEWLRARVGTDWFLAKNVAFGPFLDLSLASSLSSPRGDAGQVLWEVGLGFRLALDVGLF
jgi:hypothetical protein